MPRRTRIALASLIALVLVVALVPATPWVRERLATLVVDVAANAGYTLEFDALTGNAWRGLTLSAPIVRGPGLDLEAQRLRVGWFAPALFVGELPLRLTITELAGEVRLGDLAAPEPAAEPMRLPIRPRIDEVQVDGSDLRFADVPFTLPDLTIDRLDAASLPDGGWRLGVDVRTPDGALSGTVTGGWDSLALEVHLDHADATVARAWWDGVHGGTVSGDLRWGPDGADGSFVLQDGAVRAFGIEADAIEGPVTWRGDLIEASWTGSTLDGAVTALGTVDVGAARWTVDGEVDVGLPAASRALTAYLGAPSVPAADEGRATGRLRFDGWTDVTVDGDLAVDGAWLGADLVAPRLALMYGPDRGFGLDVEGRWGDGPLRLSAQPEGDRTTWELTAGPVEVVGIPVASASGAWTTGAGGFRGRANATTSGDGWTAAVDAVVDEEGLQAFVSGTLLDEPFEGALAARDLSADAPLEGSVGWTPPASFGAAETTDGEAAGPIVGDPDLLLTFDGTWASPRARISLDGEGRVAPAALAALAPTLDLRGSVDLAWVDGEVDAVGVFGPVTVGGRWGALEVGLAEVPLGAGVAPEVAAAPEPGAPPEANVPLGAGFEGTIGPARLVWQGGELEGEIDLSAALVEVPGLDAPAVGTDGTQTWSVRVSDEGVLATADEGRWRIETTETGWRADVAEGRLVAAGRPASLDLVGDPESGTAAITAAAGAVRLDAGWDTVGLDLDVHTGDATARLTWTRDGGRTLDGTVDLASWTALGGPDVTGEADVDGSWNVGQAAPTGRVQVTTAEPWPAEATLEGDGVRVAFRGTAPLPGLDAIDVGAALGDVEVAGTWTPASETPLQGEVHLGPLGPLTWTGAGLQGAGRWEPWTVAGVEVPSLPWTFEADADGDAELTLGGVDVRFDAATRTVAATVDQTLRWTGHDVVATGTAAWSPSEPDGRLDLRLALEEGGVSATVDGDRAGLRFAVEGGAAAWGALATPVLGPQGAAELAGAVAGGGTWDPDAGIAAEATWRAGDDVLATAQASWSDGDVSWSVTGTDWRARGDDASFSWTGTDVAPAAWFAAAPVTGRASGNLAWDADGWDGMVSGTLEVAGAADVTTTWRLVADGRLTLEADALIGDAVADARATLGPDGTVTGAWSARLASPDVRGAGTLALDADGLQVAGDLDVAADALGPVVWPAFGMTVAWRPGEVSAVGRGPLTGDLAAGWRLPIELAGADATLDVALDSTTGAAQLHLEHPLGRADLTGTWDDWQLSARVETGATDGPDGDLGVDLRGAGPQAAGHWRAGDDARPWAEGGLELDGTRVRATLDGDGLHAERLALWPAGRALVTEGAVEAEIDAEGWRALGTLEATATGGADGLGDVAARMTLDGTGAEFEARVEALGGVRVAAAAADLTDLPTAGVALEVEALETQAEGRWTPNPTSGWALDLTSDDGRWQVVAAGAESGTASLRVADDRLDATWSLPEGRATVAGDLAGVDVDALLRFGGDGAPQLDLQAAYPPADAHLDVTGPLDPVALEGELAALGGEPTPLRLTTAPTLEVVWGGLTIGLADGRVVATGTTSAGQLPSLILAADGLGWHPEAGWSGSGRASAALALGDASDLAATAELVGDGSLQADVRLSWEGQPVGTGEVVVPARFDAPLAGHLELNVPLPPNAPDPTPWSLQASGPVGGRLDAPTVELALTLDGPRTAQGSAVWNGSEAQLELAGEGLALAGAWRPTAGGTASVELQGFDLTGFVPFVEEPRLDLSAEVGLDAAGAAVRVDAFRLVLPNGEVTGDGRLDADGGVVAAFELDVDLADVDAPGPLTGRVRGPLAYAGQGLDVLAAEIDARLALEDVSWAGIDTRVDADVQVSGAAGDPTLRSTWRAEGGDVALAGGATWRPAAGEAGVQAVGRLLDVDVDVDLRVADTDLTGTGRVARGAGIARVEGVDGAWTAVGEGAWAGWTGRVAAGPWRLEVVGDLGVVPSLEGRLAAQVALEPEVRLTGTVEDVVAAGFPLGDLELGGDLEAGWWVRGERLTAEAEPDLRGWLVTADDVVMPIGTTTVDATWRRSAAGDAVQATWRGDTPVGPVDLTADLVAAPAAPGEVVPALEGTIAGSVAGGSLTWPIARTSAGWSGVGTLTDATVLDTPVTARLALTGSALVPDLAASVQAVDDAWSVEGEWVDGRAQAAVEVATPVGRVAARGRMWPDLDVVVDDGAGGTVRLRGGWREGPLRLDGAIDLGWGPVDLALRGPNVVRVSVDGLDGGLTTTLPPRSVLGAWSSVREEGWRWSGTGAWSGEVLVGREDGPLADLRSLEVALDGARVRVHGAVDPSHADVRWRVTPTTAAVDLPELAGAATWDGTRLDVRSDADGEARLHVDLPAGQADLTLDLAVGAARVDGTLGLGPAGWTGALTLDDLTVPLPGGDGDLAATVRGAGATLVLDATLRAGRGVVTAAGRWDGSPLVPAGWGPARPVRRELEVRVNAFDLAGLGGARALGGIVAGSVALRGDVVVGQFAAEPLELGSWSTPAILGIQGRVAGEGGPEVTARLDLAGSRAVVDVDLDGVSGFAQLEGFPLHEAVAAAIGPSDVIAQVTGAVRLAWPWGARRPDDIRVATEHVRLERAGVVTTGNVAFAWDGVALTIGEAAFEGRGAWRASGSATPEALDLELVATDADFGPLLGLVPSFARFGVTAAGDMRVRAAGTLTSPDVVVRADVLEVGVAGTRYRFEDVDADLVGAAWSARAAVAGVAPLGGRVQLVADGRVGPYPSTAFALEARAVGDLDVPVVGRLADLEALVRWSDTVPATVVADGTIGGPVHVEGTLTPLDVSVTGSDLDLSVPFLFVGDATVDTGLRLTSDDGGITVSGRLDAREARIDLAARQGAAVVAGATTLADGLPAADAVLVAPDGAALGPAAVDGVAEPTLPAGDEVAAPAEGEVARALPATRAAPVATETPRSATDEAAALAARERVRFDGVRIVAPQRVTFAESFGTAEAAVDLTLDGTAAAPRLAGTVRSLRGTLRFAGRDLELTRAVAAFDPARGVFPTLSIEAQTTFDKARVVPPGLDVQFTAPAGPRFDVDVAFDGEASGGPEGFALDLTPRLSSNALVEGLNGGTGARALTEIELLTLVALGRLEVTSDFAGAVAQNALDAAVDLLVTAEIQAALSEALGIDVVELRTTSVSSLLEGDDPFGVSLRLGGYLSDEVFASYRVSTLDGAVGAGAFSNELALTYQLGPVAIDVTGRVDVAADPTASTGPALAVGARYDFTSDWSLEFGVDLSTERSTARLGVTWRW